MCSIMMLHVQFIAEPALSLPVTNILRSLEYNYCYTKDLRVYQTYTSLDFVMSLVSPLNARNYIQCQHTIKSTVVLTTLIVRIKFGKMTVVRFEKWHPSYCPEPTNCAFETPSNQHPAKNTFPLGSWDSGLIYKCSRMRQ